MTIRIVRITGHQFKGQDFTVIPQGQNIRLLGENGVGKTTVADAVFYVFTGKDMAGNAKFKIKTMDPQGNYVHGLTHWAEVELEVDGEIQVFRKTFTEIWSRVSGSTRKEFSGHQTTFTVNGVDLRQVDYQKVINGLVPEGLFRLLATPAGFHELPWKKQRELLMEVCGQVTNQELFQRFPHLAPVEDLLKDLTEEELRAKIKGTKVKIKEELDHFPARTEEVQRTLPGELLPPDTVTGLEARLAEVASQEEAYRRQLREDPFQNKIRELTHRITSQATTLSEINRLEADIRHSRQQLQECRNQWELENAATFHHPDTCTCSLCGQAIPEDQRHQIRERAKNLFEEKKAAALASIHQKGTTLAKALETKEARLKDLASRHQTPVKEMENELQQLKDSRQAQEAALQENLREAAAQADKIRQLLHHSQKIKEAQERMAQLEERRQFLQHNLARLDEDLALLEAYTWGKATLLQEKVNNHFQLARFRLFDTQVKGDLVECCEALCNGVPYNENLNQGHRVLVSLDIIKTLSRHYGITLPLFIENRESLTWLPPQNTQVISLVAREEVPELKMEVEEWVEKGWENVLERPVDSMAVAMMEVPAEMAGVGGPGF